MKTALRFSSLAATALSLTACASLLSRPNPVLASNTVEVRGDTTVYRGYYRGSEQVRSEFTLIGGGKEGFLTLSFPSGKVEMTGRFKEGRREGEFKTFHPNGQVHRLQFCVRDTVQPHRNSEYDSAGNPISEWKSLGDSLTGYRLRRKDGRVTDSTHYVHGLPEGLSIRLGDDGDTTFKVRHGPGRKDTLYLAKSEAKRQRTMKSILKVVQRKSFEIKHAYNTHLSAERFEGKVTLHFAIRQDGHVAYIFPTVDTSRRPGFAKSVLNVAQKWRFKAVQSEDYVAVNAPFIFEMH